MHLPLLLPDHLKHYGNAETQDQLFESLQNTTEDLIQFFEYSSGDLTWTEEHQEFTKTVVFWLTYQVFEGELSKEYAKRSAKIIQKNYVNLRSFLPLDIEVIVSDKVYQMNSLLLMTSCDFFQFLCMKECRDKNRRTIKLEQVDPENFSIIEEFISIGKVENLWRKQPQELLAIIDQASKWDLLELVEDCERVLRRYIDSENALQMLVLAHNKKLIEFKNQSIDFINNHDFGLHFEKINIDILCVEFLDFKLRTLENFQKVKQSITHLICSGSLTEDPLFEKIVADCPFLIGLDISRTFSFSPYLQSIPSYVKELDISKCAWLTLDNLKKLIEVVPLIETLKLGSNVQLTYATWVFLRQLKVLKELDISRCHQLTDEDFKIILQSCPQITHLNLDECIKLTDRSLFDISKRLTKLLNLNLGHSVISDAALIEITSRSRNLLQLNLSYCRNLTDKGVLEAVRQSYSLEFLNIAHTGITREGVERIKNLRRGILVNV